MTGQGCFYQLATGCVITEVLSESQYFPPPCDLTYANTVYNPHSHNFPTTVKQPSQKYAAAHRNSSMYDDVPRLRSRYTTNSRALHKRTWGKGGVRRVDGGGALSGGTVSNTSKNKHSTISTAREMDVGLDTWRESGRREGSGRIREG